MTNPGFRANNKIRRHVIYLAFCLGLAGIAAMALYNFALASSGTFTVSGTVTAPSLGSSPQSLASGTSITAAPGDVVSVLFGSELTGVGSSTKVITAGTCPTNSYCYLSPTSDAGNPQQLHWNMTPNINYGQTFLVTISPQTSAGSYTVNLSLAEDPTDGCGANCIATATYSITFNILAYTNCPSASVVLSTSTIATGGVATASAPYNEIGGIFASTNPSVASISGSNVNGVSPGTAGIAGQTWKADLGGDSGFWTAAAVNRGGSSPEGEYMTVAATKGFLWVSTNYGVNWSPKYYEAIWMSVAMSDSGQYQTAVAEGDQIYVSSDYGNTWTKKDSVRNWQYVAMSGTGQYQLAAEYFGSIYRSQDYGATWAPLAGFSTYADPWEGLYVSDSGQNQLINFYNGSTGLYSSGDFGMTWALVSTGGAATGGVVTASNNGQYILESGYNSGNSLYISSDSGSTWTTAIASPGGSGGNRWSSVSMSSTGNYMLATVNNGQVYESANFGSTWTPVATNQYWWDVSAGGSGQWVIAAAASNDIYISSNSGSSFNVATRSSSSCSLSPSTITVTSGALAAPASVTLDNSTCGEMVINWTGVAGANFYRVYRNTTGITPTAGGAGLLGNNIVSTTYTDSTALVGQTYYYWVSAVQSGSHLVESSLTPATGNPGSITACTSNLGDSNLNVVGQNGNQLYNSPSLPYGSQCNSGTTALPAGTAFKLGDIVTFAMNLCNDQGSIFASQIAPQFSFINIIMPTAPGYTDFQATYNGSPLTYDGVQAQGYNSAFNHYYAYGTAPDQTLVFNLKSDSDNIAAGAISELVFKGQLAIPASYVGTTSRFQNSFSIGSNAGNGITTYNTPGETPIIPFVIGFPQPVVQEIQ